MHSLISAFFILTGLSFLLEYFLKPRPSYSIQKRFFSIATLIHLLFLGLIFLAVFLVFHRPFFSTGVALVTLSVLVIVSNAKQQTLREPLVFSDIAMFSQAFKHPRLYLPFLGLLPAIGLPLIAGLAITGFIQYEPALYFSVDHGLIVLLGIALIIATIYWLSLKLSLSQNPNKDIENNGLLASLIGYSMQAKTQQHQQLVKVALQASPLKTPKQIENENKDRLKPNFIVIQSESFFDARALTPSIKTLILKNYDKFCKESMLHGELNVPAWGANTMRTEFSVLSGIPSDALGFYQFYPYQYLYDQNIPTLASYLRQRGYYSVCIHPHPVSFFGRDRIFPKMGFDEFIDIESFDKSKTFGPYLSDQAVTEKIIETLSRSKQRQKPLFVFVITMENHGPLHLEKTDDKDISRLYSGEPPEFHHDLTVYLRHLKNADQMLADLHKELTHSKQESVLCFYGDHVPSMPRIYQATAYKNENSNYFVWNSYSRKTNQEARSLNAENLLKEMLDLVFY